MRVRVLAVCIQAFIMKRIRSGVEIRYANAEGKTVGDVCEYDSRRLNALCICPDMA